MAHAAALFTPELWGADGQCLYSKGAKNHPCFVVGDHVKRDLQNLKQLPELFYSEKGEIRGYLIRFLITAGINCHKITCVGIPEQYELEISEICIA